jgi:hypothetical protein
MDLAVIVTGSLLAGVVLVVILQFVVLARLSAIGKQMKAASGGSQEGQPDGRPRIQRSSRDSAQPYTRPQRPAQKEKAPAAGESSLRNINLRLKNAERDQEQARRQVRNLTGGSPGSERNGQQRQGDRPPRKRGKRRGRGRSTGNRQGQQGNQPSGSPRKDDREDRGPANSQDGQRVAVKRRVLGEERPQDETATRPQTPPAAPEVDREKQQTSGADTSQTPAPVTPQQDPVPVQRQEPEPPKQAVQPPPAAKPEAEKSAEPADPARETQSEPQTEPQRQTTFGRR